MPAGVGCKRMTNLPPGWRCGTLQDVVAGITTGVSVNGEDRPRGPGEVGVLKISCVLRGRFDPAHYKTVISADRARVVAPVTGGTILVSRANTAELVGASAYVPQSVSDLFLPDKLWQLKPGKNVDVRWLSHVVADPAFRPKLASAATGTSASMKNISQEAFLALAIAIPPLPEQRRVAAILGTWDAAIEKGERLLDAAQRQFEALRTELYREDGSEERLTFGGFLDESRIPGNDGSTARKLTVKLYGKGIGPKQDRTAGSANTRYYIRRAGQFIYSRLDFLNGAFAVVPDHLDGFQSTLDLPAFDIAPRVSPIWLLNYVTRPAYYENQQNLARGQRVARRVNPDDLLASEIAVPTRERQDEVAALLTLCIDEINSIRSLVAALRRQKTGLMQKLLTGQARVPAAVADLSPAAD